MEFQFPCSPLLLAFLFLLIIVRILKKSKAKKSNLNNLPPGPWRLPLIGNMHQLISSLPHHSLRDLAKKYGALMQLQLGEVPTIVVSSAEIAEELMKSNDIIFSEGAYSLAADVMSYNFKAIIFAQYGNYWRQMRKICTMELLNETRVQTFQSMREEKVSDFIKSVSLNEGSPINLSEKIFSLAYGITARAATGKKSKGQEEFIRIMKEAAKLAGAFCLADMYPSSELLKQISGLRIKLEKLHQSSDRILENIVNEHKEKRNRLIEAGDEQEEDLVDVLLKLQQKDDLEFPLTNDNIKAVIQDILGAGSESLATIIEWEVSEILKNQELMKKAQNETRSLWRKWLHPPALLILRECRENCVINGYDIPAKTEVIVNAWAIGKGPCYWKEAEEFSPETFLNSSVDFRGTNFDYIPFGAGRRICYHLGYPVLSYHLQICYTILIGSSQMR
ncbi:hypothetical protein CRYUN_Cryun38cG0074600 [Craigia yunnanensis]